MMFTSNVTEAVELVPFEEALREMQAGPPTYGKERLWLTEGVPLVAAVAVLVALYFAV